MNVVLLMLSLIPYIKFAGYVFPESVNISLDICKVVVALISIAMYFKKNKCSKIVALLIIYQLVYVFSTVFIINDGQILEQVKNMISIISICMIFEMGIKENPKTFFKSASIVFGSVSIICICTMFKYYPHGMYRDSLMDKNYYLLGQDNASFFDIFPSVLYLAILSIINKNKISAVTLIYTVFLFVGFLYVNSITAVICLLIIILYIITNKFKIWDKLLTYKNIVIFSLVLFFLLVVIGVSNISFLVNFVENILKKSVTLTGRTDIWAKTLKYIGLSPVFGYGMEKNIVLLQKFGINHVHNIFLQIMYNGGIVALLIFGYINRFGSKKINECKSNDVKKLILLFIFVFFIMSMFDYYNHRYLQYTIFIIACSAQNINNYIENLGEEKECLE